jgi:N utilization substance protein B
MFKQELPLMFPENEQVQAVAKAFFDDREAKFVNGILDAVATEAGR